MKRAYIRRIASLEAALLPPFAIPDDLHTLSDTELDTLVAWCDWMCGPMLAATIAQLSDVELEVLIQMDDASADAYIRERMQ